jgi:hypothetical protein
MLKHERVGDYLEIRVKNDIIIDLIGLILVFPASIHRFAKIWSLGYDVLPDAFPNFRLYGVTYVTVKTRHFEFSP